MRVADFQHVEPGFGHGPCLNGVEHLVDGGRPALGVAKSPICAQVTSAAPSGNPVVEAAPPAHCATFSQTFPSEYWSKNKDHLYPSR
jgi:hypothetical protein